MPKKILTITFNPSLDKTVEVQSFHLGQDNRTHASIESVGGKGINVSRVLNSLKAPTHMTGFLGGATGKHIKEMLKNEKLGHTFIDIKGNSRSNLTVIDNQSDQFTRVIEQGPKVTRKDIEVFLKKYVLLLKQSSCVVCAGSILPGMPTSIYTRIIRLARKAGVDVVVDAFGATLASALSAKPFLIKPNREEAQELLGTTIRSKASIKEALLKLHQLGASCVTLTLDKQGAVVSDGNYIFYAQSPKLNLKHYVGCGDAFIGGFLKGYYNDFSLSDGLRSGIAAGSANALTIKPGHIEMKSYRQFLTQINVEDW